MTKKYKMYQEIMQQPIVIRKLVAKHIKSSQILFSEFSKRTDELKKIKRFIFLGCGTSSNAALFGNLVFEEIAKLNCEFEFADVFNQRNSVIETNTAVVILSQSGETAEAIKAAKIVKTKKSFLISITNNKKSKLAKLADVNIDIEAGKEIAVPATKTFTSQLLILLLLALFVKQIRGGKELKLVNDLKKISKLVGGVVNRKKAVESLAMKLKDENNIIILGSKYNYPVALEGALKLKEAANIFAEGMTTEEFEHGPKALSGGVCLIKINGRSLDICEKKMSVSRSSQILQSILLIIPLQFLAFYLAIQKGINVDKPRNIKKFIAK